MDQNTGIQFKIYLADKTAPGKQEGWVRIWSNAGTRITTAKSVPFDRLEEIPKKIQRALDAHGITWPKPT
jgi:hypothetical protein